jgi:hypothetical protein
MTKIILRVSIELFIEHEPDCIRGSSGSASVAETDGSESMHRLKEKSRPSEAAIA